MAFLGKFGISGALDKVLASGDIDSPDVESALTKLLDNRKEIIGKVIENIKSGPKIQYSISLKLLNRLIDNSTIEIVMQQLPNMGPQAQSDVSTLLNTSQSYDPHLLLPHLKEPLSLEICRDMIMAHRRKFTAAKLLKAVIRTKSDLWEVIFELIHGRADNAAFPEAMALLESKDQKLREHATEVIADYSTQVAIETLQKLLHDDNPRVHSAALRGLTRVKANLPAATVFELMKQMKKDEVPLVKALLGHCQDPSLVKYLNRAIFDKKAKLRPLAIQSLAVIANEDNITEVFQALADKPQDMQTNILQSLVDTGGEVFIDAIIALADDPRKDVRELAIQAVALSDAENPKILETIRKFVAEFIPADIKISFINKLGELKDKAAVPALIKIMRNDEDHRMVAVQALEKIADPAALPDVFEMLAVDDSEFQCRVLSCLEQIIPKNFAGQIREQLLDNADKFEDQAQTKLIELVETITEKHHLPKTTAFTNTIEKLKSSASGEMEFDIPMSTTDEIVPSIDADNPFGGSEDAFGNQENDVFGTGEIAINNDGAEEVEDLAIDLSVGEVLANRYKLKKEIGRGGYGSVWLVEDTFIKDQLVMKFLHQQLISDEIAIERFIRELRLARKITHTNIIRLFDYLDLGKIAAISMEYFPGEALSSIIHKGAMEPARVTKLAHTISIALETAHQADVIHRDMKPANILVDEKDMVKIVDFGIAAASKHAESRLTRTGTLVGTPTYISPEQIQGKPVDGRTDMYSLGIIMYEMLTGQPPYSAEDPMALVFMHVEGNARRLETINPLVPVELADIVHHCIQPEPDKRFESMAELARALSKLDFS